jgi:hypothetical protein
MLLDMEDDLRILENALAYPQRALAAFLAISFRLLADMPLALARPPMRPRATAAAFFPSSVTLSSTSPVAIFATMTAALGSAWRFSPFGPRDTLVQPCLGSAVLTGKHTAKELDGRGDQMANDDPMSMQMQFGYPGARASGVTHFEGPPQAWKMNWDKKCADAEKKIAALRRADPTLTQLLRKIIEELQEANRLGAPQILEGLYWHRPELAPHGYWDDMPDMCLPEQLKKKR